jgi:hypothetical protein
VEPDPTVAGSFDRASSGGFLDLGEGDEVDGSAGVEVDLGAELLEGAVVALGGVVVGDRGRGLG